MYYIEEHQLPSFLCDSNDRMTIWGLAQMLQEVAQGHSSQSKVGYFELMEQHKAWVLTKMYFQVHEMPYIGERIKLRTWARDYDGLYARRETELIGEDGSVKVAVSAYWVIINYDTRRVVRLNDIMADFEHHPDIATDRETISKLKCPEMDESNIVSTISISNSMIDHTSHVNNAEYIKWICDNLPGADTSVHDPIKNLEIHFHSETHRGEMCKIYKKEESDNVFYFKIDNNRGISIVAKVTTK